jgi:hypothetical protein
MESIELYQDLISMSPGDRVILDTFPGRFTLADEEMYQTYVSFRGYMRFV